MTSELKSNSIDWCWPFSPPFLVGTIMGAVDLQAFLAMFVIFGSLLLHLTGKPFDTMKPKMNLLHQLEVAALSLCWFTFWGGMLFYLGHEQPEVISEWVKVGMSILIVAVNTVFLIFAVFEFVKEFINDYKHKAQVKRKTLLGIKNMKSKLNFMVQKHQHLLKQQLAEEDNINGTGMAASRLDSRGLKLTNGGSSKVFPIDGGGGDGGGGEEKDAESGEELSFVAISDRDDDMKKVKNWEE